MARKPLIEPGSVLPASETDVMSRVLERDRAQSGRKAPGGEVAPEQETPAGAMTPPVPSDVPGAPEAPKKDRRPRPTEPAGDNITRNILSHIISNKEKNMRVQPEVHQDTHASAHQSSQEYAREYARVLAQSSPLPITLRLPEGLNDWLDDHAHRMRKQGVKKQDLVSWAVQLLVIEVMTGGEGER